MQFSLWRIAAFLSKIYIHSDGKLKVSLHMMFERMLGRFSYNVIGDKEIFRAE